MPDAVHGLVLAGGEGSRLAAGGLATPKPLVEVQGIPLITRQVESLAALGCNSVTCMVREGIEGAEEALARRSWPCPVAVHACHTPSSLHTLDEGLSHIPAGPVFAVAVDTVMQQDDWRRCWDGSRSALGRGADLVLTVTRHVDDERPLYVACDAGGRITSLGEAPVLPLCVTGGAYALAPHMRGPVKEAVARGVHRLRAFLADAVKRDFTVMSVEVPHIIDLDRPSDLAAAEAWLAGAAPEAVTS